MLRYGMDLRHNQELETLIPGRGVPQLELMVSEAADICSLLRYMRDGGKRAA